MPTAQAVKSEIMGQTIALVKQGLANDQSFPVLSKNGLWTTIAVANSTRAPIAMKTQPYEDAYRTLRKGRVFNVRMVDGALIHMMYEFHRRDLSRHRLAFWPAPDRYPFQGHEDLYLQDETDGDVAPRNVAPLVLRYDYDGRDGKYESVVHPKSHLTLGQYKDCRIPVSSPVSPRWFIDFVLRNFYDSSIKRYADDMPSGSCVFAASIVPGEKKVVHVTVP